MLYLPHTPHSTQSNEWSIFMHALFLLLVIGGEMVAVLTKIQMLDFLLLA